MINTGLAGKVVLVTGAERGIGEAVATAFAAQGARVALHYFTGSTPPAHVTFEHNVGTDETVEQVSRRLVEAGAAAAVRISADLAEPDAAPKVFDEVEQRLGQVDVLVNNAAHCENPDQTTSLTFDGLHRNYRVNLYAPALLTGELARRKERDAVVVNISTDAARAFPGQVGYGTSKAALEAFTRAAAIELGPAGIRVNTIAPGPVQTGWMPDDLVEQVIPSIPLRRVGEPADIADAAVFLASDQARWITGQVVQVAGGHAI